MASLYCPDGNHEVKIAFKAMAGERFCPQHRCALRPIPKVRNSTGGRHSDPALDRLEANAHAYFKRIVCSHRCFLSDNEADGTPRRPDHVCTYPLDPHHLVEVQWMRRELALAPEELIAVMFDPIIGAPVCRGGHGPIERRVSEFIYWDELRLETIEFCERIDRQTPEGVPSMLTRLEMESPKRRPDPQPKESVVAPDRRTQ